MIYQKFNDETLSDQMMVRFSTSPMVLEIQEWCQHSGLSASATNMHV